MGGLQIITQGKIVYSLVVLCGGKYHDKKPHSALLAQEEWGGGKDVIRKWECKSQNLLEG